MPSFRVFSLAISKGIFSAGVSSFLLLFATTLFAAGNNEDQHQDAHEDHVAPQLYPAVIVIDPREVVNVVVKINARVRNLRSLYVGQRITRGEILGELESAELETVQRTYLGLITNLDAVRAFSMTSNEKLIDARMNLAWRGMSEADIKRLDETKEPLKLITLKAPVTGYLYTLNVVNEQIVNAGGQSGVYTTSGTTVATIAKPEAVYVEAQIPLAEAKGLKLGMEGDIILPTANGARSLVKAKVAQVFTYVNPINQRKRVRLRWLRQPVSLPLVEGLPVMVQFKGRASAP